MEPYLNTRPSLKSKVLRQEVVTKTLDIGI